MNTDTPVLLFGSSSMAGHSLTLHAPSPPKPYAPNPATDHIDSLKLEDLGWIQAELEKHQPDMILYCHAICNVGECEQNPTRAMELNVGHVERLLSVLPDTIRLVYISSDHVFGGDGIYTEADTPCPISVYGKSRCEAEARVRSHANSLIIRHSLIIGPSHNGRSGHLDWIKHRSRQGLPMTIIEDEYRSAIMAGDFAERVLTLAHSTTTGLRHITSESAPSRKVLAEHLTRTDFPFQYASRHSQIAPHLGRVELNTMHEDPLSTPLPSPIHDTPGLALRG